MSWQLIALYALVAVVPLVWHTLRWRRREQEHRSEQQKNVAAGLNEPPSLHPVVDRVRCIGSSSCVALCPEGALGIVGGKASLINASACIGHGACQAACPFDAISLVFGTEKRGIDIPLLSPDFQTNVPGIYIAGELGGMGLIRKAAEQGRQAMAAIAKRGVSQGDAQAFDVVIIGAGPAGLSAGLSALEAGLRFAIIEQEHSLGGAIFHYPRQKIAMTSDIVLALVGRIKMREISKEDLLAFWKGVTQTHQLGIRFGERMERIETVADGLVVHTTKESLKARAVLLAIGRRGTPRTLDVPGEDLSKVTYRLVDPQQYAGQQVLVIGGGDSALEAAIALAGEAGTRVTLSYRSAAFSRVKGKNRDQLAALQQQGRVDLLLESQVERIDAERVVLRTVSGPLDLPNDAVIICAGGVLPTPLLQQIGIQFQTKYGTA
jgi:thioredoxin reductase (NADPH)